MSEKKDLIRKIILDYIDENIDPENKEEVKKFDELLRQLELKNI